MGIATTDLSPIEQTAFPTEYARALDSQWRQPILGDHLANEVVGEIDYDFARSWRVDEIWSPQGENPALRVLALREQAVEFVEARSARQARE